MQEYIPAAEHRDLSSETRLAHVIYALQAASYFGGLPALIAIVLDYIKLDDVRGTWLETHYRWQIRTFWYGLLWAAIGILTLLLLIGWFILFANFVWLVYRVARGWLYLNDRRPMPV